jgi:DNA mismatch repair protein MutL
MSIIKKLSREEAQKIAAGEVVERPASVVKELVENAIDAGATNITVTIEDGGKKLIAVRDNGCGMDPVDARLCIAEHATSKIQKLDDLFALHTFGFRGEALSSLAAVSDLVLTTKDAHHAEGLRLTVHDGIIAQEEVVAHEMGTLIEVKNLFSTVPARLKFLKKNDTEHRHIAQLFDALFLAHPTVHAKLIVDSTITKNYPATKTITQRAEQILMHKAHGPLSALTHAHKGIMLEGAISNHQIYRFDKSAIYIFVNRRWVKNVGLTRAVLRAYTALPKDKYPIVSLHITIDPAIIDVNIHPRKEEVAFTDSFLVEQTITAAIKEALEKEFSASLQQPTAPVFALERTLWQVPQLKPFSKQPEVAKNLPQEIYAQADVPYKPATQLPLHTDSLQSAAAEKKDSSAIILGQVDATYIIASTKEGLIIVDQHAAHERILYELFVTRFGTIDTVQLLFPEIIHLTVADYELALSYQKLLAEHGIIAEPFGAQQIRVTALPVFAKHISAHEIIASLITTIHDMPPKADAHHFLTNALRAQMACKAAVKAGDILTTQQMEQLLHDLNKSPNKLTCPHGRPTYWTITIAELEKKFQRTL